MKKDKSAFVSFLHLVSSTVVVQLIQVITVPIVLRYFIPEEYGKVALYSSLFNIYLILIGFTEMAKIRYSRQEYELTGRMDKTFWGTMLLRIPIGIMAICLVLIYRNQIVGYLGIDKGVITLIIVTIAVSLSTGASQFLFSLEKFSIAAYVSLTRSLIRLLFIGFLVWGLVEPIAMTLLIFTLISTKMVDFVAIILLRNKVGRIEIDWDWIKQMVIFSLPFILIIAGGLTVDYVDSIIIKKYLDFGELGVYSAAYKLYSFGIVPFMMINSMMNPKIITYYNEGKMDKIKTFYKEIIPQISFFVNQFLLIAILFSPLFVYFVGSKFSKSIPCIAVLLGSLSWLTYSYLNDPYFIASKKTNGIIIGKVTMALTNVILGVILVQKIGIIGAAISTVVARFVDYIIGNFFILKKIGISNIKGVLFGIPVLITSILVGFDFRFEIVIVIAISLNVILWYFSYKYRVFSIEGLNFINQIGIPGRFRGILCKFYSKLIYK